ncbi:MAG TPA: hypothetical protein VFS34_02955, partial [Thermoanaerobaculia bacterium]|nr:hypothetical protein [Thermoanaerobaculia bacterium]
NLDNPMEDRRNGDVRETPVKGFRQFHDNPRLRETLTEEASGGLDAFCGRDAVAAGKPQKPLRSYEFRSSPAAPLLRR